MLHNNTLNGDVADHVARDMAWPAIVGSPDSMILLNAANEIAFINSAARKNLNLGTKGLSHPQQIFTDGDELVNLLKQLKEKGSYESDESTIITGNGDSIKMSCKASVIVDARGSTLGALILLGLASHGRLSEYATRLESKVKELDQFAYIISHDLKAPLRAIGNLTNWIKEDLDGTLSGDVKQNMDMLIGRVTRMEALINGVLDYSKVGRLEVKSQPVDVHVLLTEVIELLAPPSNIQIKIAPNMPSFTTKRILLSQVFSNLISNAIKYNDKKESMIDIGVEKSEVEFTFFVKDNGSGIAKEHHEKIFVIFQTLQARDKFESTGVGLTIVKRIIEEQGGTIRLESVPGEGSTFIFTWPYTSEEI
jgi:signal transduction histidine kinase